MKISTGAIGACSALDSVLCQGSVGPAQGSPLKGHARYATLRAAGQKHNYKVTTSLYKCFVICIAIL